MCERLGRFFDIVVVERHHPQSGPGPKVDSQDGQWIVAVFQHGLRSLACFRP